MRSLALTACLLVSSVAGAQRDSLLDGMHDQARPVLIFAGAEDPRVHTQARELLGHRAELAERQMRILLVTTTTEAEENPPIGTVVATAGEGEALRRRFHVAPGAFTLLLIGKDGGEKFRSTHPVPFETLRSLVDAMPMRRQEMRSREHPPAP